MKVNKIFALMLCMALFVHPVFSDTTPLNDLKNGVEKFSESLVKSLPFNAAIGLNWSDAYIGKVFPSLPPHFGIGVSAGMTSMKIDAFKKLLDVFDAADALGALGNLSFMPIPAYAAEARVGGLFLPFDLGLKFGMLPENSLLGDVKTSYTLLGASLRIAPLELLLGGNPLLLVLPNISVGVGMNYLKGGISDIAIGKAVTFGFSANNQNYTLELSQPKLGLSWETTALDFTLQVSKSLLIITPYIGVGVSRATSKAGYGVQTTLTTYKENNTKKELDDDGLKTLKENLESAGLNDIDDVDANGFESIIEKRGGMSYRAFGGFSLNLAVIRIDLTGMFNFTDQNWGVSLGTRFQL